MIDYLKRHLLRNIVTLVLVGGLCSWSYFKSTGNVWVWLFIPIVIISFFIPLFERLAVKKDSNRMMESQKIKDFTEDNSNKRS